METDPYVVTKEEGEITVTRPCNLMLVFSLQPYGSTAADVMLIEHDPIPSDNITFNEGPEVFHLSRSNPFTAELKIWTVRRERNYYYVLTYC